MVYQHARRRPCQQDDLSAVRPWQGTRRSAGAATGRRRATIICPGEVLSCSPLGAFWFSFGLDATRSLQELRDWGVGEPGGVASTGPPQAHMLCLCSCAGKLSWKEPPRRSTLPGTRGATRSTMSAIGVCRTVRWKIRAIGWTKSSTPMGRNVSDAVNQIDAGTEVTCRGLVSYAPSNFSRVFFTTNSVILNSLRKVIRAPDVSQCGCSPPKMCQALNILDRFQDVAKMVQNWRAAVPPSCADGLRAGAVLPKARWALKRKQGHRAAEVPPERSAPLKPATVPTPSRRTFKVLGIHPTPGPLWTSGATKRFTAASSR